MNPLLILGPVVGLGLGMAAAYGTTRKDKRIHFVESDNLRDELDDLDIHVGSQEQCVECGDLVEPNEVGAIVRQDGEYRIVCEKDTCLDTYDLE